MLPKFLVVMGSSPCSRQALAHFPGDFLIDAPHGLSILRIHPALLHEEGDPGHGDPGRADVVHPGERNRRQPAMRFSAWSRKSGVPCM